MTIVANHLQNQELRHNFIANLDNQMFINSTTNL